MAVDLTEAQRQKVRLYLGYGRGRDIHPRLESRFEGFLSAEEADEIADVLAKLAAIETQIGASSPVATTNTATGNIKALVGEVEFFGAENNAAVIEMIYARGRRLIQRLVILFEVEPLHDYFGDAGAASGGCVAIG